MSKITLVRFPTDQILSIRSREMRVYRRARAHEREKDKSILGCLWKGNKTESPGEKSRNIERLSSRNVRFCWIVSTRERREAAIRFEKGTETVTVHPVTCAVMPICCHGRFLRFPSSLPPPPFLLRSPPILSIYPRARYTRGTMDKLDKRYDEREREEEGKRREREREEDGDCIWGGRVANNVANRPEKECYCEDRPRRFSLSLPFLFFFSPCSTTSFFSTTLFFISLPRFYILVSDDPRLESAPRNAINTKKIRTNYHQFFTVPWWNIKYIFAQSYMESRSANKILPYYTNPSIHLVFNFFSNFNDIDSFQISFSCIELKGEGREEKGFETRRG